MGVVFAESELVGRRRAKSFRMRKIRPGFIIALIATIGVYFMARTKTSSGKTVADEVIEAAANAISSGPRGIRNNNPGNIERKAGTVWRGMSPDQSSDSRFAVFLAPEWGVRAIARILRNYMARGKVTIAQIIATWAPPTENDTNAYVAQVSRAVGVDPNVAITPENFPALIAAIIKHENGQQPYPASVIARGIDLERTA